MRVKKAPKELAIFGGKPIFHRERSTSNLVKPDIEKFLNFSKKSFEIRWLTNNGPLVQELEKRLSKLHQVEYCVSFCSGFWCMVICMKTLALENRKEVIMPTMSYRRLGDIAAWAGLTPCYCDIDEKTLGPSVNSVESCINDKTGLLLMAQPIVNICDMEGLTNLASKYDIPIIFDSVEAGYASYKGKMVGSFGNAECFSMHASKLLNGFEGGYLTTNDESLAKAAKKIRAFGFYGQDSIEELGFNAKLNEIHAAMALACLGDLNAQIDRNKRRYHAYKELLDDVIGIEVVEYDEVEKRGFKNILVRINDKWPLSRNDTLQILHAENMIARPYYSPLLSAKKTSYKSIVSQYPVAEMISTQYMLLPCGEFVSVKDIQAISLLLNFLQNNGTEIKKNLR